MKRVISYFKREKLLSISIILALISLLITPPTGEMVVALSWSTLASLFLLFLTLEGLKRERLFDALIVRLGHFRYTFTLSLALLLLVFLLSPFITNDVALLTFVPITIMSLKKAEKEKFIIPLLSLMTIAANLGSILTPFGNPQNLYIYNRLDISSSDFILMLLPLWLISLVLLILALLFVFKGEFKNTIYITEEREERESNKSLRVLYICLFVLTLISILGAINIAQMLLITLAVVIVFDRSILKRVDYSLLLTFLCFFIFSASLSRNESIKQFLSNVVSGREFIVSLITSWIISNVPAAILLEPFATSYKALLFGVDVGGLGTPIASLASLITIRIYMREEKEKSIAALLKNLLLWNGLFLIVLIPLSLAFL